MSGKTRSRRGDRDAEENDGEDLSSLQSTDPVVALACSDLHLQLEVPLARMGEPNWFKAMARPLNELEALRDKYKVPILCSGDIFDRWNASPELINFAMDNVPYMLAIPGQHDLPYHNLEDIDKSAFMTLVKAERIALVPKHAVQITPTLHISGFAFGVDIEPCERRKGLNIALIHRYVWIPGHSYPGALPQNRAGCLPTDYDLIVSGDNHKGFLTKIANCLCFNCGSLVRRKADEIDYEPQVGIIHASGKVELHLLDTDRDKINPIEEIETIKNNTDLDGFFAELASMQKSIVDFTEMMERVMDEKKVSPAMREILTKAMEKK